MRIALALLLLAALGLAIGYGGGFDPTPQWIFAGTAAAAGAVAFLHAPARTARLALQPAVLVLLAIGLLSAVSAAWTIGATSTAFRAGAVVAGYGLVTLGAGALARPAVDTATLLAAAAAVTALTGLVSVALLSTEFAERIAAQWQAEGPLGYAPALALLQIAALPVLLVGMARGRALVGGAAAGGAALAAGVVVLAANRVSVALTAAVLGVALAAPARTVRARRADVLAAVVLIALAGLGFHLAFGGRTPRATAGEAGRLLLLALVVAAASAAWLAFRRVRGRARPVRAPAARAAIVAAPVLVAAAIAVGVFSAAPLGERTAARGSFTHGRIKLFDASWDTFLDRSLQGYGAGTFFEATLSRQAYRQRVTRFAHDLPLELGVELGTVGIALGIALYLAAGWALWRARRAPAALWLLGPAVAVFLVANLLDWSWHLAGAGAVFALSLGGLAARREAPT